MTSRVSCGGGAIPRARPSRFRPRCVELFPSLQEGVPEGWGGLRRRLCHDPPRFSELNLLLPHAEGENCAARAGTWPRPPRKSCMSNKPDDTSPAPDQVRRVEKALKLKQQGAQPDGPDYLEHQTDTADMGRIDGPSDHDPPMGALDAEGHRLVLERSRKVR